MSLNDRDMLSQTPKGDIYPEVANLAPSSGPMNSITANFVNDPTTSTVGHKQAQRIMNKGAGVIEHHPGIIESTNIEPLHSNRK